MLPSLWADFCLKKQQHEQSPLPQSMLGVSTNSSNQLKNRHSGSVRSPPDRESTRRLSSLAELESTEPKFQSSFWLQLKLLTVRASRQQRGQRLTRVALLLALSWITFTCLAWGRLPDTTKYTYNRASLLFFLIITQSNSVVTSSLIIFSTEQKLLSRERAKKMFGVLPYFIALTLSDMVNSVVFPTLCGVIVYWVCNLRPTASAFFTFVLTLYLSISTAQSTGLFLSVLIPNTSVALMLAPFLTICLMIIGGFYIPLNLITPYLRWLSWLSFGRYGFSAFIINEFGGRYIACDDLDDDGAEECPYPGSAVISSYGIEGVWTSVWANVGTLIAIQIFLRVTTYILLLRSK